LTDTFVDKEIISRIEVQAMKANGVQRCSNIRIRKLGHYFMIDLAIHVDPSLVSFVWCADVYAFILYHDLTVAFCYQTVAEANKIIAGAKDEILHNIPRTAEVMITLGDDSATKKTEEEEHELRVEKHHSQVHNKEQENVQSEHAHSKKE
jgi:divalent metal cation (Fe/Co/Zn/Cd) transporter